MPTIPRPSFPTIAVFLLLLVVFGGVIPAYYASTQGNVTKTFDQQENQEVTIFGDLHSILINVDQSQGNEYINVTIFDIDTGESNFTDNLFEGDSQTFQFENGNVTVKNVEVTGDTQAIVQYTFPIQYQWNNTQRALILSIPVTLVILLLYLILMFIDLEVDV